MFLERTWSATGIDADAQINIQRCTFVSVAVTGGVRSGSGHGLLFLFMSFITLLAHVSRPQQAVVFCVLCKGESRTVSTHFA